MWPWEFLERIFDKTMNPPVLAGIAGIIAAFGGSRWVRGKAASANDRALISTSADVRSAVTELLAYARKNEHHMSEVRSRVESMHEALVRMQVTDTQMRDDIRNGRRGRN